MPVRRRLAVRDGLLPAVALNYLCYDGAGDERWETSGKISHIATPQSSVPPVKTHNGSAAGGGGGGGGPAEEGVQVLDNLTAKGSDMRSHSRPGVNVITSLDCQQTCQPEGTFP